MIHIDKEDIYKIARQLDALYTALKCFIYYTELRNKHNSDKNQVEFLHFIEFTLLYTMLINWIEIFGINKNHNHWKEVTLEEAEYINRLYAAGGYNYTSWTEYRNYINELSNSFIVYPDPYHHKNQAYNLEGIKISLEITHNWLYELVSDNSELAKSEEIKKWPITNKNLIEDLKQEIQLALGEPH